MSYKANSFQQITLNDRFLSLPERSRKIVEKSWAKDYADIVFPAINEDRFSVLYSDNDASRPNTPINSTIVALILKEQQHLSDDELIESIHCDVRFQYAMHTTHLDNQPYSDRTFSRFRERLYNYTLENGVDLLEEEMKSLADHYTKIMNLDSNIKRMDSLMVASHCKRMSRLEILYTTTSNAVKLIHRLVGDELLSSELLHYLDKDDENEVIYYCKGEDITPRLEKVINEACLVRDLMGDDSWHDFVEYQLLIRVLNEQTDVDDEGNVIPKSNKNISTTSVQNPSDPDATFRSKAGKDHKGYVANIIESIDNNGNGIITDYSYETNNHSDSEFCKDYLNNREEDAPAETMIADGAYGGQENHQLAEGKNVNLVTTALTGQQPDEIFSEFELSEDGRNVIKCPAGNTPVKNTYYPKTGVIRSLFPKDSCDNCPYKDKCKGKQQKKNYAVHISQKMVERAAYKKKLSTTDYKALTKMRNAIEGIPSVLRRKYRIDEIPVFGHIRSKFFVDLKIGAYNICKLRKYNQQQRDKCALNAVIC